MFILQMAFPRWTRYSIWLNLFSTSPSSRRWIGRTLHAAVDQSPESDRSASGSEVASHSSDERETITQDGSVLKELLVVSSDFSRLSFYDWQPALLLHSQGEEATGHWRSRVMKRLLMLSCVFGTHGLMCFLNKKALRHEGCAFIN